MRGLQSLGRNEIQVGAVARVALNLRGVDRRDIGRAAEIDVALRGPGTAEDTLHSQLVPGAPLRVADVGLLRDPGQHRIAAGPAVVGGAARRGRRTGAALGG